MVSYNLVDGKILLHPKPDKVEKAPFPRYAGHWSLSSRQLARFTVKRAGSAQEIVHDCGAVVATVQTGSMLALVVGSLAEHVCADSPLPPSGNDLKRPQT